MVSHLNDFNLYLLNLYPETIVDGAGIRYSIYLSGCTHGCKGCHNITSWQPTAGTKFTDEILDAIILQIQQNPLLDGITLSGGDPFFNPVALLYILNQLTMRTHQNIWCYTGYTYAEVCADPAKKACLYYIDTLVDGKFDLALFDPTLSFRGSSNQQILHLNANDYTLKT